VGRSNTYTDSKRCGLGREQFKKVFEYKNQTIERKRKPTYWGRMKGKISNTSRRERSTRAVTRRVISGDENRS